VAAAERLADDVGLIANVAGAEVGYREGALAFGSVPRLFHIPIDALAVLATDTAGRVAALGMRPASLGLEYLDPDRDFQAGRQQVARGRAGPALTSAAPLVATAPMARALASRWLRREEAAAETLEVVLGWQWIGVSVGDIIVVGDRPERWRVVRRTVRGLMVHLASELVPPGGGASVIASDAGRALSAPVAVAGPTRLAVFETPMPLAAGAPSAWISATGGPGWRGARVSVLTGGEVIFVGDARGSLVSGVLEAVLPPGPGTVWDEDSVLVVRTERGVWELQSRSSDEVLNGANLVRVGQELVQYRHADPVSADIVRLTGLLRRRFGSGYVPTVHAAGTAFSQLRPELLHRWPVVADMIGSDLVVLAAGPGDLPGGVESTLRLEGLGLGALAPCHLGAMRDMDGAIRVFWTPRHRDSIDWSSTEPPPASYLWRFEGGGILLERTIAGTSVRLSAAEQLALHGALLPPGVVHVVAVGDGPEALRRAGPVDV
jgi:hypothetical protein